MANLIKVGELSTMVIYKIEGCDADVRYLFSKGDDDEACICSGPHHTWTTKAAAREHAERTYHCWNDPTLVDDGDDDDEPPLVWPKPGN